MKMQHGMRLLLTGVLVLLVVAGCRKRLGCDTCTAGTVCAAAPEAPAQTGDDGLEVWFRDGDLDAMIPQGTAVYTELVPGESGSLERSWDLAPPQIPHSVEGMLPILGNENFCVDCHLPGMDDEAVDIPESHFLEVVMASDSEENPQRTSVSHYQLSSELDGTRWNCTLCHAPQATNVKNLPNRF